ncbi:MAG: DNA-binding response regulator [Deltaproteobacteria bacterium]|nr:MAG: DNA-binding response regulator [Deltaproteobacteria bacterium]
MEKINILVAEDDTHIRNGLIDTLESEGYRAVPAKNGQEALEIFRSGAFGLVLLDIMMPAMSGYDVCRAIRKTDAQVPVIMLTAKSEEIDKVLGLELGADDYITKPFGVRELLARIGAVLRRSRRGPSHAGEGKDRFQFGPAEIDRRQYRARIKGQSFDLSERELKLIDYFRKNPDAVLSRDELLNAVWGIEYYGTTRTLDQHIAMLRKKVEPDPARPRVITTAHGIGYRFNSRA